MSRQRALAALSLEPTDRIPNWNCFPYSLEFVEELTGIDPRSHLQDAWLSTVRALDLDVVGHVAGDELPADRLDSGEVAYDGATARTAGVAWGDSHWKLEHDFSTPEQVLDYDPVANDSKAVDELRAEYQARQNRVEEARALVGDAAWIPDAADHYHTLFMWPISVFGWEMFLQTAALYPREFGELLGRFAQVSMKHFEAWSRVAGLRICGSHDDLCMTRGPVFRPEWYREYIFPWYPRLWKPLKDKGIKIIFRGDGNLDEFVDDLVECGVDGLYFRSETDLRRIAEKHGGRLIMIGNISTQVLTFGSEEDIADEVERCVDAASHSPGFFLNVAGEIPHNVPPRSIHTLFAAMQKHGRRS